MSSRFFWTENGGAPNTLPRPRLGLSRIGARGSETPHRLILLFRLGSPPDHSQDYRLQAEVWHEVEAWGSPWWLQLDPRHQNLWGTRATAQLGGMEDRR
ncbi:hypothetical protein ACVW0L_001979 [Thermostichus sp. OS-CIW-17]